MSQKDDNNVVLLDAAQAELRDHFLGWQCRIRQMAVRDYGGQPLDAMRPLVTPAGREEPLGRITVLLNRQNPYETTAQLKHIVRRTPDPLLRLEDGMKLLQGTFYQKARDFSDVITALFGPESKAANLLVHIGRARLDFAQFNQAYRVPCEVRLLSEKDEAWQATYWHNSLFNPNLPGDVKILAFKPDWAHASADPPLGGG